MEDYMPKNKAIEKHDEFKVGGHTYKIERNPDLIRTQGLWGQCNHVGKQMRVDASISTRDYLCTMVHEFFEAIKAQRELELPHNVIQNVEDATFACLIDNIDLFIDVLKEIKKTTK